MITKFNKNQLPETAVLEAPKDGKSYVRNDGQWIEAESSGGTGVETDPLYTADKPKIVNYTADGSIITKDNGVFGSINKELTFKTSERPIVIYPGEDVLTEWKLEIVNNGNLAWENNTEFVDPSPKGWRVPTVDEWSLLISHPASWTTRNGINGLVVENCFLPAAGQRKYTGTLFAQGSYGWYWTKTPYSASDRHSNAISFNSTGFRPMNADPNVAGQSVRCVRDMNVLVTDPLFVPCPAGSTTVSGVTWANCNVDTKGVFVNNEYDYGHYFQWGQAAAISTSNESVSSVNQIAYLEDIVESAWIDITENFVSNNPALPLLVRGFKKEIVIVGENTSNVDIVIEVTLGYGSARPITDYTLQGSEGGATGFYDASITAESGTTKTVITIPKEIKRFDIKYFKI